MSKRELTCIQEKAYSTLGEVCGLSERGIWHIRSSIYFIKRVACFVMEEYVAQQCCKAQ